jgi:hypothetical protein
MRGSGEVARIDVKVSIYTCSSSSLQMGQSAVWPTNPALSHNLKPPVYSWRSIHKWFLLICASHAPIFDAIDLIADH